MVNLLPCGVIDVEDSFLLFDKTNNKSWFIHFYREFGEWLQVKIKPEYLTNCICGRLAVSNPERLSKEYCKRVGIKFRCASCLFPQYDNLKGSMRGNVNKIYEGL